jgi:fructoselysine-6-P-deglycase FrlB-like protein
MLHITYLLKGLCGFAALSSFSGFVFHAFTGNPDMALIYFVGIGGSAAMAWLFAAWQR